MDAVKSFNQELSSLYEVKPPISKAKMTALTRGAIKAIKFYKHVVQSVEKFILKCKPDYKVPGLYVIDSIVRQSRHQFGSDKDVFAPRFSKNLQQTFVNLYQCPPEDKSKIIRVLNLWQKNNVFQPDVIQPLFDLADPNNPIYKELENSAQQQQQSANGLNTSTGSIMKGSPALQRTPTKGNQPGNDSVHGATPNLNFSDPNVIQQLQQLQRLISKNVENTRAEQQVHFDRKLLDYDYGDDEDEIHPSPRPQQNSNESILPVTSLLTNPEVLRQLQTLQQTMASASQPQEVDVDKMRKLQEMKQQEDEFDKHLAQTVPNLPFASECDFRTNPHQPMGGVYYADSMNPPAPNYQQTEYLPPPPPQPPLLAGQDDSGDVEVINLDNDDSPDDKYRKRRRSRSRSKDRRGRGERERDRKRSRSRSGSRRYRSRSRERNDKGKGKEKREDKERETEKDKERKKRGLPVLKRDHLSVCSTTLWVGHLSKLVHQDDLSNTFGEFGDVVSIDLIPPRGCAFIVMLRRQDAARCLAKLKGHVLHGKAITLAWAPGKGVKGKDLKDYWEGDLGVSYVPFNKIKEDIDLDLLEDGGMIDEDTMPDWMREKVERMGKKSLDVPSYMSNAPGQIDTSQPPPMPGAGMLQPPPMMPMVSPFQFNNRMIGMMHNMPNLQNIPLGVPPPTMGGMMANQLIGIGSPFQGPPGMMPPQMPPVDSKPSTASTEANLHNLGKSLMSLTQSFGMVQEPPAPHDDVMDVEMEDAEKSAEKPPAAPFGEQQGGGRGDDRKDRREERDRRVRSRDRDRDRGDRDRGGRNQDRDREGRKEGRERDFGRGRDRDRRGGGDRRDRNDRWGNGERDREARGDRRAEGRDAPEAREERRDREKTLNDRLREMAGMGGGGGDEGSRDRNRDRSFRDRRENSSRFDNDSRSGGSMRGPPARDTFPKASGELNDRPDRQKDKPPSDESTKPEGEPKIAEEAVITLGDEPSDAVVQLDNGVANENAVAPAEEPQGEEKPLVFEPPGLFDGPPDRFDGPPDRFDGPPDRFEGPPGRMFDGPPDRMYDGPDGMYDGPPDGMFDGPPDRMFGGPPDRMMFDGPPDLFDGPPRPWGRGRGRRGGGRMDPMEGGPPRDLMDGGPPMHFRGRRDFGGRGGMRGPPPDGEFFGRDDFGPPMMMRGARGHRGGRGQFFAPRGRGRGQFRDGPNFNPRFDGPPFDGPPFDGPPFRGGPGPRMHPPFGDGPPMRFRGAPPPAFDLGGGGDERGPAPSRDGRRSRWAAQSPSQHDEGGEMAAAPGDEGGQTGGAFDGEGGDVGGDAGGAFGEEAGNTGGAFGEGGIEGNGREEVSTPVADERSSPHQEAEGASAAAESALGAEPSAE